jgi:transposase
LAGERSSLKLMVSNGVGDRRRSKHHRGTTMKHYAGIDVSLECSSVCVVDGDGKIVREGKVASEPGALICWFAGLGFALERIGLEAGPLSQWLYAAMKQAGLAMELLETRHVRDAFKAMPVKSDRNDARGIAQLMRLGWFRPVHCKSMAAQETRAVLTARKLVQSKLKDVENSLRGILRGFGLKVGQRPSAALPAGSARLWPAIRAWRRSPRRCYRCMRLCCASSKLSTSKFGRWRAAMSRPNC